MSEPSAAERAYRELKARILAGQLPGVLDFRDLSDRLRMSVTPVREALARLSAERLVRLSPHHGYTLATVSARRLSYLYDLSGALADLCLKRVPTRASTHEFQHSETRSAATYAEGMTALLRDVAATQGNLELAEHLAGVDDRLLAARRCEPLVFSDCATELEELLDRWKKRHLTEMRVALRFHYAQRIERVDAVARQLAEASEET